MVRITIVWWITMASTLLSEHFSKNIFSPTCLSPIQEEAYLKLLLVAWKQYSCLSKRLPIFHQYIHLKSYHKSDIGVSLLLWSMETEELIVLLPCSFVYLGGKLYERHQAEGEILPVFVFSKVSPASLIYNIGLWNVLPYWSLGWPPVEQSPFVITAARLPVGRTLPFHNCGAIMLRLLLN
jgi:hypothetical protein